MRSVYSLQLAMVCMLHHVYDVLRQVPLQQSHGENLVGLVVVFVHVVVISHIYSSAELGGSFALHCFFAGCFMIKFPFVRRMQFHN